MHSLPRGRLIPTLKAREIRLTRQQKFSLSCAALSAAIFAALFVFFGRQMIDIVRDPSVFKAYLNRFGGFSQLIFVGIRALQTVVKIIPGEPLEIGSGFAFGTFGGLALCLIGSAIGSAVIIFLSKTLGMKFVTLFISEEKLRSFPFLKSSDKMYLLLFIIYLIPGTPKDLITYAVVFTDMKLWKFLLISGFARIPSIITSTMCGASLVEKNYLAAAVIYGATLLMTAIGVLIYRKISAGCAKKAV